MGYKFYYSQNGPSIAEWSGQQEDIHLPNFVSRLFNRFGINGASEAKQGQSNTMTIDSNIIDTTGGPRPKAAAPLFCPSHGIYGHGDGLSSFGIGGPINSKSVT